MPDPGGEGIGAPLRVTVGRVSAVTHGKSGGGGPGGDRRPVIVLEVSVVGDGVAGPRGTAEFAAALRRRLLVFP